MEGKWFLRSLRSVGMTEKEKKKTGIRS